MRFFKKQTGGRGKFADIIFEIGPPRTGKMGLEFVDQVKGGNIPQGVYSRRAEGLRFGDDQQYAGRLQDGLDEDPACSTVRSTRWTPTSCRSKSPPRNGFRAAAPKAGFGDRGAVLTVEVVTPGENMGDIIGDLNKRRGQITGMESGTARVVRPSPPVRRCSAT